MIEASLEVGAYCVASLLSAALWITFGPVADAVEAEYGWTSRDVNLLALWAPVVSIVAAPAAPRIIHRVGGSRGATTAAAALIFACSALRLAPASGRRRLALAHLSCLVNGVGGVLLLSTPAMVARDVLPPEYSHLGTSVMLAANSIGGGVGFVAAAAAKRRVDALLFYEFVAAAACLLLLVAPRHLRRRDEGGGDDGGEGDGGEGDAAPPGAARFGPVLASRSYVLLAAGCGLTMGSFTGWLGVLTPLLEACGWSQRDANAVGVASCFACAAAQVASGVLATRHKRRAIVGCNAAAAAALLAFAVVATARPRLSPAALSLALAAGFMVVAPEGAIYETATAKAPKHFEASTGAGLVFAFNVPMGAFILLGAVLPAKKCLWVLVFSAAVGLALFVLEFITSDDRPVLVDTRPLNAEDEYRPLDARPPGIASFEPPPRRNKRRAR